MIKKRTLETQSDISNLTNKKRYVDTILAKSNDKARNNIAGAVDNASIPSKSSRDVVNSSENNITSGIFSRKPAQILQKVSSASISSRGSLNSVLINSTPKPIVNKENLLRNLQIQESNTVKNTVERQQSREQHNKRLLSEVDELLNKKSSHAQEADNEWHEAYSQRMTKLAQREYAQQKAEERQGVMIQISAFCCITCDNFITELFPVLCEGLKHSIMPCKVNKRTFECAQCRRREYTYQPVSKDNSTLNLPPKHRCQVCGAYNWLRFGASQSSQQQVSATNLEHQAVANSGRLDNIEGLSFVAAASEATSRKEKLEMAKRVSALL